MRILVVGCGSIGARHARNLSGEPGVEVVVTDLDPSRLAAVQGPNISTVTTLEEGLADSPDAVFVCVPNHLHLEVARQAVDHGSHVFIEKPISHTPVGVGELITEARDKGKVLMVACNMRFHRPISLIREWLDRELIGRPLFGRFGYGNYLPNWRGGRDYRDSYSSRAGWGGGIMLDAIHEIDYARWFLGEPVSVNAVADRVSDLEIDTEDTATIFLSFATGAVGDIHMDYLRPVRGRSCELVGDRGMIVWNAQGKSPEESTLQRYDRDGSKREELFLKEDLNSQYVEEVRHFLACLDNRGTPALDGLGGKRVLDIALAARQAASSGVSVKL
jgi:predicted dehydrogenase